VRSDDLRVGDLLEIQDDETIPADCLLIATQHANYQCFVKTSSLDGEKNLKPKIAIGTIQDTLSGLLKDGGKIEVCAPLPDKNLY
jgi:phospholipid-transporting ATPase